MVKYLKGVFKEKRPNHKCYGMPSSKSTVMTFIVIYLINIHKYKDKTLMIIFILVILCLYIKHMYKEHSLIQFGVGCLIGYIFAHIVLFLYN